MKKTVTIGKKDVELVANAASPFLFRQVFHEDFIQQMQEGSQDVQIELFTKMSYIMKRQAETNDFSELSKIKLDDFYAWLVEFDAMEITQAIPDISSVYFANMTTTSDPKNEAD